MKRVIPNRQRQQAPRLRPWHIFAAGFAVLGVIILANTSAATFSIATQAEQGTIRGNARTTLAATSAVTSVRFGKNYIALGDSVASGDGLNYGWKWSGSVNGTWQRTTTGTPLWEPTSNTTAANQSCRRSKLAYPTLVAASTGDRLYNPSCSGSSVVNGILANRTFDSGVVGPAQLGYSQTQPGLAPPSTAYNAFEPDVVSITLGMDDVNFSELLQWCYLGTTCVTTQNDQIVNTRLSTFKYNLNVLLKEIQDRGTTAGKAPWMVLTNYYDPFNSNSSLTCNDIYLGLGNGIGPDEVSWLRQKLQTMNQHIADVATQYPKARVANISQSLNGHQLCSTDPWVYGISIWYSDFGNPAPFHPTPEGQKAIADIVAPIIKSLN